MNTRADLHVELEEQRGGSALVLLRVRQGARPTESLAPKATIMTAHSWEVRKPRQKNCSKAVSLLIALDDHEFGFWCNCFVR